MRNKAVKLTAAAALLGVGLWLGSAWPTQADNDSAVPGSIDDPVVTKSYVDKKLAEAGSPTGESATEGENGIRIVDVEAGEVLIAQDGAEIVVRAGKAVAFSNDSNGIADVTSGTDIKNGQKIANNHLLLFPRGGRGIATDPQQPGKLTVMVRGSYELVPAADANSDAADNN